LRASECKAKKKGGGKIEHSLPCIPEGEKRGRRGRARTQLSEEITAIVGEKKRNEKAKIVAREGKDTLIFFPAGRPGKKRGAQLPAQ